MCPSRMSCRFHSVIQQALLYQVPAQTTVMGGMQIHLEELLSSQWLFVGTDFPKT